MLNILKGIWLIFNALYFIFVIIPLSFTFLVVWLLSQIVVFLIGVIVMFPVLTPMIIAHYIKKGKK